MTRNLLLLLINCISIAAAAQHAENKSWLFISHTQQLSGNWNLLLDAQLRAQDKLSHVETVLLRAGAAYNLNKQHAVALGYAFKGDWEQEMGKTTFSREHRIFQQYLFQTRLSRTDLTTRFRLEQRFAEKDNQFLFSQRARGLLALQVPLLANREFSKGLYLTIQDELFLNVYNREHVNDYLYDQNRLMGSLGYRWNSKIDTEVGYIYWRSREEDGLLNSNVVQLMITTKL